MNDKLGRRFDISPSLLTEMDRVSSFTKEYDRLLGGLKGLEPAISTAKQFEQIRKHMGFIDALPAFAKTQPLSELLETLGRGAKARHVVMGASLGAISLGLEQLAEHGSLRKQFETIAGATSTLDSLRQATLSAGILMDFSALQLVRDQRDLIDSKAFGGMLASIDTLGSLANAIDPGWGVPAWRPSFERLANISLARDIGVWRKRPPALPAEGPEREFVRLRSDQGEDDAAQLDELVHELMPLLKRPIAGARLILESRSIDYQTQFAASARKTIDLTLKRVAPADEVSKWVQADPTAPKRQKGGRGNVTFRERVAFVFRNAPEPAKEFFRANIEGIVVLRKELSDLDHDNGDDPHPRLIENQQLVERLILQILQEHRRSNGSS